MTSQDPKTGYKTTEFWIVILTALMPLMTLIFHKDFTADVQVWAAAAAGLATVIYIISRSFVKTAYVHARKPASSSKNGPEIPSAATSGKRVTHTQSIQETLVQLSAEVHALDDEMHKFNTELIGSNGAVNGV